MKNLPQLLLAIIVCELVGIIGSVFTISAIPTWYVTLNKPFFAPPNWLFGPVWTLLYFLMGVSIYLILQKGVKKKQGSTAIRYFIVQLGLNFLWSPVFFGLRSPLLGLIIIVAMWAYIVLTIKAFSPISKQAAYLLIPYLLWVSFATMLNFGIYVLN